MPTEPLYVFEDKQIVYGCESWWGEIKSPDHLREITNADIDNVWYVQALKLLGPSTDEAQEAGL